MSPTFTSGKIKGMLELLDGGINQMIDHLEEVTEKDNLVEVKDVYQKMALDVIARSVLHSNSTVGQDVFFQMRLWDRLQLLQGPREQATCVRQAGVRRVHPAGRGDHPALARVHDDRTSAGEVRRYHARTLQVIQQIKMFS